MKSNIAVIPVDRRRSGYREYRRSIKPYLDTFGIPYIECNSNNLKDYDCALIILAQPSLPLTHDDARNICSAVSAGSGLVILGSPSINSTAFSNIINSTHGKNRDLNEFTINNGHYITSLHERSERISLYKKLPHENKTRLINGLPLVTDTDSCILEVSTMKSGRIAYWHTVGWSSPRFLGPLHGMDDLLWRSIVWAAKKPFIIQGMPRFVGMRVDDVWGSWRNIAPDNPLLWIDIANKYKLKPWLGVFQDNINDKTLSRLKELINTGGATAFPHAFSGCEWVGSPIPENFIYYDHFNKKPYSDTEIIRNTTLAKTWFDENNLPLSKVALPHHYEIGENALKHIIGWGCEFIGTHMPPGNAYADSDWLAAAPYRIYEKGTASSKRPVYYADYLKLKNSKLTDKLYNMVVEIRDVCGYEWAPSTNTESTIKNGTAQLKRAFDSFAPGFLFTHESKFIQRMLPGGFEASVAGIAAALSGYKPVYETADNIYRYVRARNNIFISNVEVQANGRLTVKLCGNNDIKTKCTVFLGENESITESEIEIPHVNDYKEVYV